MKATDAKRVSRSPASRRESIIGDAPEIIMEMDADKRYTWANPAGIEFFGVDVIGHEAVCFTYGAGDADEKVQSLLDSKQEEVQLESLQRRKDGVQRFLDWRCREIKDKKGNVIGTLSFGRDITERKQIEDKLRSSEIRYRRLFETAKDGILILDAVSADIVDANPFIEKLLGYAAGELFGRPLWDIGTFRNIVATKEAFEEVLRKEYIRYEDLPLESKDGRRVAVEFVSNVYFVEDKKVIQCNIRDITERKKMEEKVKTSETRYRRLFESAKDGILILDAVSGEIIDANPYIEGLLGYDSWDLMGKQLWDIEAFRVIVATKTAFEELLSKNCVRFDNLPLESKDGRRVMVDLVGSIFLAEDKKVVQFNLRDITEREKMEQKLKTSETSYRRLFESAKDGILIVDAVSGDIVDVNPLIEEMLGYDSDDLLGKQLWNIDVFKDVVTTKPAFEELVQKKYIRYKDLLLETKDGRRIPVEFIGNVYMADDKIMIQCNIRDIAERKQMEDKLKASESRYRRLFESAKDGILILDAVSGEIDDANPFIEKLLGYASGDLLGKPLWDIGTFKNIVATKEAFDEVLRKEYIRYEDLPLESKDGRRVAVEFVSNLYLVDDKKVIQCNIRDITERKRAEEERARLAMAIEHAVEAVVVTDCRGAIEYVNPAFQQITGYTREEVIGGNPRILKSDVHDEAFYKNLWDTLGRGDVWSGRFTNKKKDGRLYEEEGTISPVFDGAGKLVGYVAIKRDITERLNLERAAEYNRQLAQIGELTSGVVHELRNPLAVISGTAELLQRKLEAANPIKKSVDVIMMEAKHLERAIAQFLGFARPFELVIVSCKPEVVVERTRKLCESRAAAKHVTLDVKDGLELPEFKADPARLAQAVVNIVNNAIDAAPTDGCVVMSVASDDKDILFEVTDNGPGIHLEPNEDIFKPFFTRKDTGTGLGLSIARRIVSAHGGTITFTNRIEGGSTFVIRAPIKK
jgi:PAS domain S-box-containing protein